MQCYFDVKLFVKSNEFQVFNSQATPAIKNVKAAVAFFSDCLNVINNNMKYMGDEKELFNSRTQIISTLSAKAKIVYEEFKVKIVMPCELVKNCLGVDNFHQVKSLYKKIEELAVEKRAHRKPLPLPVKNEAHVDHLSKVFASLPNELLSLIKTFYPFPANSNIEIAKSIKEIKELFAGDKQKYLYTLSGWIDNYKLEYNLLVKCGLKAEEFIEVCPHLNYINVSNINNDIIINDIINACRGVVHLVLDGERLTKSQLDKIKTFAGLETIYFSAYSFANSASQEQLLKENLLPLADALPCLRNLHLDSYSKISNEDISNLAKIRPNLRSLSINDTYPVTSEQLSNLIADFTELNSLSINRSIEIRDGGAGLMGRLESLHSLDLSGAQGITDEVISKFVTMFPSIKELDLSSCQITDDSLVRIAEAYPDLKGINLSQCLQVSDRGVSILAKKCPQLEVIKLNDCYKITDEGLTNVINFSQHLKSLSLADCTLVKGTWIKQLGLNCPNLQSLNLNNCYEIVDQALIEISPLLQLKEIILTSCHKLSNCSLKSLQQNCPNLHTIDLSGLTLTADEGLEYISHLIHLRSITLTDCYKITDKGLGFLANSGRIKDLNLSRCGQITNAGVAKLAQLTELETLNLNQCKKVNETVFSQISNLNFLSFLHLPIPLEYGNKEGQWLKDLQAALPNLVIY